MSIKHLLFLCSCMCSILVSAQQTKHAWLIDYLPSLERKFNVNFNYNTNHVEKVICISCSSNQQKNLAQQLDEIQKETGLSFSFYNKNTIIITYNNKQQISFVDLESYLPITDLTVTVGKQKYNTNSYGSILVESKKPIKSLSTSHVNYTYDRLQLNDYNNNLVTLEKQTQFLEAVEITPHFSTGIYQKKDGNFLINLKELKQLPGLVSQDAIKSIQNLPQVYSGNESLSDINVRGSTHDQNQFLWNGINMYQSYHLFGLISAFNENLISSISLYDNATPASYGNSVGSVITLNNDTSIEKETSAGINLNFLSLDGYVKTPINKKSSLKISARKSLTEQWESPTYQQFSDAVFQVVSVTNQEEIKQENQFEFKDAQLQYNWQPNIKNRMNLYAYYLNNFLSYQEYSNTLNQQRKSTLEQTNFATGLHWEHLINDKKNIQLFTSYSYYDLDGNNSFFEGDAFNNQSNTINNFKSNIDYQWQSGSKKHNTLVGISHEFYQLNNTIENFRLSSFENRTQKNNILALYGQWNYTLNKIRTQIGLRTVYYDFLKEYEIEPRLDINYSIAPQLDIEVRAERKTQNISQVIDLENNFLGVEKRRWFLANDTIAKNQRSHHAELSLKFKKNKIAASASVFYKVIDNISTNGQGFQNLNQFENVFGKATVQGILSHVNFKTKNFNSWISYSLLNNEYQFDALIPNVFLANNHLDHRLVSGINYNHKKWTFSLGAEFYSGKPFTQLNSDLLIPIVTDNFFNRIDYDNANQGVLPHYFRLDSSVNYKFELGKKINAKATLGIINLLNNDNIISRHYTLDSTQTQIITIEKKGLGITPNASLTLDF